MASPDRFQLDDHFAAAKARSAQRPTRTIGIGRALAGLALFGAAIAGTWWWALRPGPAVGGPATDAHPLPVTVAQRQAAVAAQLDEEARGPRPGGETPAEYQARLAAIRARQAGPAPDAATPGATGPGAGDRASAGSPAPAVGRSAATTTAPAAAAAPGAPGGGPLAPADSAALGLARRVNEHRANRAAHLRWLDACAKQHLVDAARAAIANARGTDAARTASVAANNLAADIDTHQREAHRIDGLLPYAEQRLVDYCAAHHQALPALDNPSTTVDGILAQPRPLPVAAVAARPATAAQRQGFVDSFSAPDR